MAVIVISKVVCNLEAILMMYSIDFLISRFLKCLIRLLAVAFESNLVVRNRARKQNLVLNSEGMERCIQELLEFDIRMCLGDNLELEQ